MSYFVKVSKPVEMLVLQRHSSLISIHNTRIWIFALRATFIKIFLQWCWPA